ncbi:MAG: protease SohB [bacterium]
MQFFAEYGLFLAKAITIGLGLAAALVAVAGGFAAMSQRQRKAPAQHLEVVHLNKRFDEMERAVSGALLSPQQRKRRRDARAKDEKKKDKAKRKAAKRAKKTGESDDANDGDSATKRIYVLDFAGDIRASAVASLRHEVSAILTMATARDEVVVRVESAGGAVHGYGLAASQLLRIRARDIRLTVCVDKIAASGGYMMACVADRLIAAPFAFLGSIGVIMQMPNMHRLLKRNAVDFELLHAGEHKRTLTVFGENTDKGRRKLQQELEEMHALFKQHVKAHRPQLDIERVATGEHWLGTRALELGLVDHLQTSDDYLMAARGDAQLLALRYSEKKKLAERLSSLLRRPSAAALVEDFAELERPHLL